MRRATLLLIGSSLLATSALAQLPPPGPPPRYDAGAFWRAAPAPPGERVDFLQRRIDQGIRDGSLDPHEGRQALGELGSIRGELQQMHYRDGPNLTPHHWSQLQGRLGDLSSRLRWMRHNGW